ncbi:GTP cyclohydrolase IIa [Acidilobus sp.]|uniref:GTP cyclohydrolase IIa n=1 Tax=Acidilobus sp. TaxID=1872109 RepID=UPI003D02F1E2
MSGCVKVTLVELARYREWTELLGSDREWRIQEEQSRIYSRAQEAASSRGGLAIPLRYDYLLLLTSGLSDDDVRAIVDSIKEESPVEVRYSTAASRSPAAAVSSAFAILRGNAGGQREDCSQEVSVLGHVDLDDVTGLTERTDPLEAFHRVQELLHYVSREARLYGGIAQYLGGDNILVVMPVDNYEALARRLSETDRVKVGVGVSATPRRAAELATKSLDWIRSHRGAAYVKVMDDLRAPVTASSGEGKAVNT